LTPRRIIRQPAADDIERALKKARSLLYDFDLRIKEIAFAAGFPSLSRFNRIFKEFSGESPTAYRAATRAKTVCRD
jgi:transcriptional regulator GlxA family with amidase domain